MWKVLLALGAAPLVASTAMAAQPLADNEMDRVTAGQFEAFSTADAQALGKIIVTMTATVAQVSVVTNTSGAPVTATLPGTTVTMTLYKSISGSSSSSSATNTIPTMALPISP